jgi:hypothetical protein
VSGGNLRSGLWTLGCDSPLSSGEYPRRMSEGAQPGDAEARERADKQRETAEAARQTREEIERGWGDDGAAGDREPRRPIGPRPGTNDATANE